MSRRQRLALLGPLLLSACSSSGPAAPDASPPDRAPAERAPLEAGRPDLGPTVAPEVEPSALPVAEWMVAVGVSPDPMRALLESGSLSYPKPGWDANKMHWSARLPDAKGSLGSFPAGLAYAVARVDGIKPGTQLLIRSEPTARVWYAGAAYPGDIYASHKIRVPLRAATGESLLVLQIAGSGGEARAQLWTTPDEALLNLDDLTLPHLVQGDGRELCVGVPVLNLGPNAALAVTARVEESPELEGTALVVPGLAPAAVSQVAFRLKPRQPAALPVGGTLKARLRLESPSYRFHYARSVELPVVAASAVHRRTRISSVDGSCQYYAVTPPPSVESGKSYGLALSLHGASVEALGQAQAYAAKAWTFVVAPTNRRPFGFDWEGWGRLDALEALDHALASYPIDPTRVRLTGHSMGGHGTWQVGVLHPGRFATVAPSAGWSSFYSYGGDPKPTGVFARTQASSDTNRYLANLKRRGAYILHGGADKVVPASEGQAMAQELLKLTKDVVYHEEPGMDHWWDKDTVTPGVDCVDWAPLFAFLQAHTLDPGELEFEFLTPSPWVSSRHSFVTILSQQDAQQDSAVSSTLDRPAARVTLVTSNVRSLELDGAALQARGIATVVVDGKSASVSGAPIAIGPATGKRPGAHGPFHELFYRPFCLVYPDAGAPALERYVAFLVSHWAVIGNGHACALPLAKLDEKALGDRNLIFVGLPSSAIPGGVAVSASFDASGISVGSAQKASGALFLVFPRGARIAGAIFATTGAEPLLTRIQPFTSRLVLPDYLVLGSSGVVASGLFDAEWK